MSDRIKILFLGANPADISYRIRLDEEAREIENQLQASAARDSFELISRWAVRPSDLQALLLRHEPHILHFSGHGTTKGIALENKLGKIAVINKKALAELLKIHREKIRVVLLNPSYSKAQEAAFSQSVDFTIGIKKELGDSAAIAFAAAFYRELASGRSVDQAFATARVDLINQKVPKSKTPELKIRKGVDASFSFFAQRTSRPRTKTPKPAYRKPSGAQISAGRDFHHNIAIVGDNARVSKRKQGRGGKR